MKFPSYTLPTINLLEKSEILKSAITSLEFKCCIDNPILLGINTDNKPVVASLSKIGNLLIAGSTGQGKTNLIHTILCSLFYKNPPSKINIVLIDPKKIELQAYRRIENLFLANVTEADNAIVTDARETIRTLNRLLVVMQERYKALDRVGEVSIAEYNKHAAPIPYIIVVIDEVADFILVHGKEFENPFAELTRLGRQVGIHLIIATQAPKFLTETILKAFNSRAAFRLVSDDESRIMLGSTNAVELTMVGEMLFSDGKSMQHIRCPYISDEDIERIVSFIGSQVSDNYKKILH